MTSTASSDPSIAPPDLAGQVARLFYDRGLTKVEIGERLGISRFRVARLIDQALSGGLVRIEYRDTPDQDRAAARAIEERYGLDLCVVAGPEAARRDATEQTARLAASVAGDLLGPGQTIGIAWGSTLAAVVREFAGRTDPTLTVVQLAGSSSRLGAGHDPADLSRLLAERLGARHRPLYAPAFVDSLELREALVRQPEIAVTTAEFGHLSMAIVGIGAMAARRGSASSSLLRSGILEPAEIERLRQAGAIGDLIVHPFDLDGRFVAPDLAGRAIAIDVASLRQVPRVIAVAAGATKAQAIRGALASGIVDVLVTDQAAARSIIGSRGAQA